MQLRACAGLGSASFDSFPVKELWADCVSMDALGVYLPGACRADNFFHSIFTFVALVLGIPLSKWGVVY